IAITRSTALPSARVAWRAARAVCHILGSNFMNLEYSSEHIAFQDEVQAFLKNAWVEPMKAKPADTQSFIAEFRKKATERGYLYRGFPRIYGGSEQPADAMRGQIIRECFDRARAPTEYPGNGVGMLGPTLLERGADWQKEMFLPKTLTGEYRWAQGY